MTYEELLAACTRTVGAQRCETLHDAILCLMAHGPTNRAITAEFLARLMAEFIEGERAPLVPRMKH